jgi:NAD(P)-dependent dehydrogenase (short-subunit alcohol dehydrogenase family)
MTKAQRTILAAGALALGSALVARGRRSTRRIDFRGRSVVVTGGSRGLGLLVARQLADQGARLTIAARDGDELERARVELNARGADVHIVVCDLGTRDGAERLVEEVVERTGRIDVLINNAGVMKVGPVEHMELPDFEEAMAVHFWGPLHSMLAAVPVMKENGGGRIVNVSSIGGRIGVPHLTPYCASKFALAGLSDSMRAELAKDGIAITTVTPGLMRTGSPYNAWFKGRHRDEFAWFLISDSLPLASIDGELAARQLIEACRYGDAELTIGWPAKLAILAHAVLPEAVALTMSMANQFILPGPSDKPGGRAYSGWQSMSDKVPSALARLSERAASANNEVVP